MKTIKIGDCVGFCETGFHYGTVVEQKTKSGKSFFKLSIRNSGKKEDISFREVLAKKCWYERRG